MNIALFTGSLMLRSSLRVHEKQGYSYDETDQPFPSLSSSKRDHNGDDS